MQGAGPGPVHSVLGEFTPAYNIFFTLIFAASGCRFWLPFLLPLLVAVWQKRIARNIVFAGVGEFFESMAGGHLYRLKVDRIALPWKVALPSTVALIAKRSLADAYSTGRPIRSIGHAPGPGGL